MFLVRVISHVIYNMWYDQNQNDLFHKNTTSYSEIPKKHNNRRLLIWISFFEMVTTLKEDIYIFNGEEFRYKLISQARDVLLLWWQIIREFQKIRFHWINLAKFVNFEMNAPNDRTILTFMWTQKSFAES